MPKYILIMTSKSLKIKLFTIFLTKIRVQIRFQRSFSLPYQNFQMNNLFSKFLLPILYRDDVIKKTKIAIKSVLGKLLTYFFFLIPHNFLRSIWLSKKT